MEESCSRVDARRPVTIETETLLLPILLLMLLLRRHLLNLYCYCWDFRCDFNCYWKTVVARSTTTSTAKTVVATSPATAPLLCFYFVLRYCPAASNTAANCHQRYGSKQRGGRPRRWGSVICRSM